MPQEDPIVNSATEERHRVWMAQIFAASVDYTCTRRKENIHLIWLINLIKAIQEIDILGAVFDRVGTLASKRPPYPRSDLEGQQLIKKFVKIDILEASESISRYETEMVY